MQNPTILIFINTNIRSQIQSELSVYVTDLATIGYSYATLQVSGGTVEDIKNTILSYYNAGYNVEGAVLIGNIPAAWFNHTRDFFGLPAEFPCDLFLMDLDGSWQDPFGDGVYDIHVDGSGDTAPEIYIGRIDASNMPGNEVNIINKYLRKIHEYRVGNITFTNLALTYTDKDWINDTDFLNGIYNQGILTINLLRIQRPPEKTF